MIDGLLVKEMESGYTDVMQKALKESFEYV